MERIFLVFIFAFSLFLKVSIVAGAEPESNEAVSDEKATTINNTFNISPNQVATPVVQPPVAQSVVPATPILQTPAPLYAQTTNPNSDAAAVLGTTQRDEIRQSVSIIPTLGASAFNGRWYDHVRNTYTFGLMLDMPVNGRFSVEAEGNYGKYHVSYAYYGHDFKQFSIGGNAKFYLSRSVLQPYIGLGLTALRYEDMTYGPMLPYSRYSQWIGAAQAIAGVDVEVARNTAIGIRGQWVLPVINRPGVEDNGVYAYPYYEEASLMNTSFFRVMGSVRLMF